MNKQEIKDLIAAKIAGQGNQVDSGGALAEILDGIIEAMPSPGLEEKRLKMPESTGIFTDPADIADWIGQFNGINTLNVANLQELHDYFINLLKLNSADPIPYFFISIYDYQMPLSVIRRTQNDDMLVLSFGAGVDGIPSVGYQLVVDMSGPSLSANYAEF